MAELFGFKISRKNEEEDVVSFTSPSSDDGTLEIPGGGFYSSILDTDGRDRADIDLIRRYRDIAQQAECDTAIEDIVNEGIVSNESDISVQIVLESNTILLPKKNTSVSVTSQFSYYQRQRWCVRKLEATS